MFTIKDLCGWYGVGPKKMRKTLIEEGVIPESDHGIGGRPRLALSQLRPIFAKFGTPKGLTLSLEIK